MLSGDLIGLRSLLLLLLLLRRIRFLLSSSSSLLSDSAARLPSVGFHSNTPLSRRLRRVGEGLRARAGVVGGREDFVAGEICGVAFDAVLGDCGSAVVDVVVVRRRVRDAIDWASGAASSAGCVGAALIRRVARFDIAEQSVRGICH